MASSFRDVIEQLTQLSSEAWLWSGGIYSFLWVAGRRNGSSTHEARPRPGIAVPTGWLWNWKTQGANTEIGMQDFGSECPCGRAMFTQEFERQAAKLQQLSLENEQLRDAWPASSEDFMQCVCFQLLRVLANFAQRRLHKCTQTPETGQAPNFERSLVMLLVRIWRIWDPHSWERQESRNQQNRSALANCHVSCHGARRHKVRRPANAT